MNNKKFYLYSLFSNLTIMMLSGAIIQTFFVEKGVLENDVNVFLSLMQIIQVGIMLLVAKFADSIKNVIKITAYIFLLNIPLVIFLIILSFFYESEVVYWLMYLTGIISNVSIGLNNIMAYKFPYHVINMKDYGKIIAFSGIVVGIISTLITLLLSFTQKKFGYFEVIKIAYIFVLLLIFAYVAVTNSFKSVYDEKKQADGKAKISILKYKPFTYLVIPNILRGFSLGMINTVVTVGYYIELIDSYSASILIVITNVGNVLGSLVYSRVTNRINEKNILLTTSIAFSVLMPLIVAGNTFTFLLFYAFAYFVVIIINYSIPVAVTRICDYKVMGQYSAGRMLINTLGTSLAGFLCIPMIDLFGALVTMTMAGLFQLIAGIGYYIYITKEGFCEDNI